MPIIDIQLVSENNDPTAGSVARALADALGKTFNIAPGHLWLRLQVLPAACYAENEAPVDAGALPVFVNVLHARLPETAALAVQAERIAAAVADGLGRPVERVHVEYAAPGLGRIAFGGKLVQD